MTALYFLKEKRLTNAIPSDGKRKMRQMNRVAVIPARGGSKRIPNKNIKLFSGRPIISYSIKAARESGLFDRIIVSTDSEEIANVARQFGAEIPFLRPAELSGDQTPTAPVIDHCLTHLGKENIPVDYICCIYATAPLLSPQYIRDGFRLLTEKKAESVFSVTEFEFPIFRGLKINRSGRLEMFWPENESVRSQDLPKAFHDAGQFYWLAVEPFLKNKRIYTKNSLPVILPRTMVQDMDEPEDWTIAEAKYRALQTGKNDERIHSNGN